MTALYFGALRAGDVVATKAHASPVLYAIEYLRGRLRFTLPGGLSYVDCRDVAVGEVVDDLDLRLPRERTGGHVDADPAAAETGDDACDLLGREQSGLAAPQQDHTIGVALADQRHGKRGTKPEPPCV